LTREGIRDTPITPREAFESYQVRSRDSWKYRALPEVYQFYLDVWQGKAKVLLMLRSLKSAQDVAEVAVPGHLVLSCLMRQVGDRMESGQYPLDAPVIEWLPKELWNRKGHQ
jgi:hypothetical protein